MKLFDETDLPDIFLMREILGRLSRFDPTPNRNIQGDWIIYWASKERAVDEIFGTGITIDSEDMFGFGALVLDEFLLQFSSRKQGRKVLGVEVAKKTGPFPNQSNVLKGTHSIVGTRGLKIQFDDIKTAGADDVEVKGEKILSKTVEVDVLYASKGMIALQTEAEAGEYDFFVLTPIDDIYSKHEQLLGQHRRRFLFN